MGIRAVNKVIRFIESRDVEVRKGRDNVYYPEDEVIIYNAQGNYNGQLYTLLHEAGHFLQSRSRNFTAMNPIYEDVDLLYTNYQKFRLLEQEMDAWDRGLKLAKYLKIKIDIIDYRKCAAHFIMQYVKVLAHDKKQKMISTEENFQEISIDYYGDWLKRMALKFLENPDNEVIIFLEDHKNNLIPVMIQTYGLEKIIHDLTKTIDSLR